MSFYTFRQNNPGGYFNIDQDLGHYVIIEADSDSQARSIAEDVGIYFDGVEDGRDCGCCGNRWSDYDLDAKGEPMVYDTPLGEWLAQESLFSWCQEVVVVHFLDGTKTTHTKEDD